LDLPHLIERQGRLLGDLSQDGMHRIAGQAHLVQPFPDPHAGVGRIVRGALIDQRALAALRGFLLQLLETSAMVKDDFLLHHGRQSAGRRVVLTRTRAQIGQSMRVLTSRARWPVHDTLTRRLRGAELERVASSATCADKSNSPLQP
jgi:hypothetical protein